MSTTPDPFSPSLSRDIDAVRAFNRFYTQRVGVLDPYLGADLSLTEVRVLYELAHRDGPAASELGRDLALDAGYLSRILRRFESRGWLQRAASAADARRSLLRLTAEGRAAFAPLEEKSRQQALALLAPLTEDERHQALGALQTLRSLLDPQPPALRRAAVLRDPQPGDLGWVVEQHGALYAREHGYTRAFEGLVAEVASQYLQRFDPAWDRGWIAELDGRRVGCVFVVRKAEGVAQLRLLLLLPAARGQGLGGRLVDECIRFARDRGYRRMVLWTNGQLAAARAIYAARGFQLTGKEALRAYGQDLVSETWELALDAPEAASAAAAHKAGDMPAS